jgi:hypothetical protein
MVCSLSLDLYLPHRQPKKKEGSVIYPIQRVSNCVSRREVTPRSTAELPPEEEGKNNRLRKENKNKSKKRKQIEMFVLISSFAGDGGCHCLCRREDVKKPIHIPHVSFFFSRQRVNPCAASGGDEWIKRSIIVPVTQKFPALFPNSFCNLTSSFRTSFRFCT